MYSLHSRWWLAPVLISTIAIRVSVIALDWDSLAQDPDSYGALAGTLARTGIYGFPEPPSEVGGITQVRPTAFRPPLYPTLLSLSALVSGQLDLRIVAGMHVALGVATVLLVYWIAERLRLKWPALPALVVAVDPLLLRGSQLVMTETLITFLATAIWLVWLMMLRRPRGQSDSRSQRARISNFLAGLLGVLLGLSILTRPTLLPWAVCLIGLLGLRRVESGKRLPMVTLCILMALAVVLPWGMRNKRMLNVPVWTTTHSGYTLLLANNPSLYAHFKSQGVSRDWDPSSFHDHWALRHQGDPTRMEFWSQELSESPVVPAMDELPDDRLAQRAALAVIQADPWTFGQSCIYRAAWFWGLAPNEGLLELRIAVGVWYGFWFLWSTIGIFRIGNGWTSRIWLAPAALVLTLTLIHMVFWSNMRMRSPLMPMVYVVASVAMIGRMTREPWKVNEHADRDAAD